MRQEKTPVKWLVEFATAKLDEFRAGDWLNARADLLNFIQAPAAGAPFDGRVTVVPDGAPRGNLERFLDEYPEADIAKLQTETQSMLENYTHQTIGMRKISDYLNKQIGERPRPIQTRIPAWEFPTSWNISTSLSGQQVLEVRGEFLKCFFFLVSCHLFWGREGAQPRLCPECGMLFFRIRKQIYCSPTCNDRVLMRTYRKDQSFREGEAKTKRDRRGKLMANQQLSTTPKKKGKNRLKGEKVK